MNFPPKKQTILSVTGALVVGLVAFTGGIQFQKSQGSSDTLGISTNSTDQGPQIFDGQGQSGGRRQFSNGQRPTSGEVASITSEKMTITTPDGTTNVLLSGNPTVTDQEAGQAVSLSDIKVGDTVLVMGTTANDGTITAQRIVLNPTMTGPGGPPTQTQNGTGT